MGIGMARGFLYIAVRLLGWACALAAGIFCAPVAKDLLAGSFVGERVHESLSEQFGGAADQAAETTGAFPSVLGDLLDQAAHNTADMLVAALEGLVLSVLGFVLVVILARLVLILIIKPLSKRRGNSPVSFLNKLAGLLVGGAEGLLLAFLFLAALIPAMHMASADTAASIAEQLRLSYLAGPLYDGNLLLAIFG